MNIEENEVVCVVALDKGTGYIRTATSCNREDAQGYAKYYRRIGCNTRILTYEDLDKLQEQERKKRYENCGI